MKQTKGKRKLISVLMFLEFPMFTKGANIYANDSASIKDVVLNHISVHCHIRQHIFVDTIEPLTKCDVQKTACKLCTSGVEQSRAKEVR